MSQRGGFWRHHYTRPADATGVGTAGVLLVRGMPGGSSPTDKRDRERVRHREREALRERRAQQDQHLRTTGYLGNAELGNAVAYELRQLGYSPAIASFGGHLVAPGGTWNFQGNPRLAQLVGRSLRSAQRYRAKLELAGLIRSHCLEPGDILDGQSRPVSHPQVVRDLTNLRALALARLAQRPLKSPHKRTTKAERAQRARAQAAIAPPRPEPVPVTPEQLRELAQRPGVASWVTDAILGRSAPRGRAAANPGWPPAAGSSPPPALSDDDLDALDAELRELTEQRERERERPPDPPPN